MCIEAKVYGIICFGMGLTLREGNREYFYRQLDCKFPGLKEQYIKQYGNLYEVVSPNNDRLMSLFRKRCEQHGVVHNNEQIFSYLQSFEDRAAGQQLSLFSNFQE